MKVPAQLVTPGAGGEATGPGRRPPSSAVSAPAETALHCPDTQARGHHPATGPLGFGQGFQEEVTSDLNLEG